MIEKGFKDIEQRLGVKMAKAMQRIGDMMKSQERRLSHRGDILSESKDLRYESHRRMGLASKSFSPMSNTSRSNQKNNIRSSVKKGRQPSILNMSNEVSQLMMRSLSPSI
jgi:hypothetical protein